MPQDYDLRSDPLPSVLTFDTIFSRGGEQLFEQLERHIPEEFHGTMVTEFLKGVEAYARREAWRECASEGTKICYLASMMGMNVNNLYRNLPTGQSQWSVLWVAKEASGLGPVVFEYPALRHCQIVGIKRVAEYLCHRSLSCDLPREDAKRFSVPLLSVPHAALLSAIHESEATLNEWLFLSQKAHANLYATNQHPRLTDKVAKLYQVALASISEDVESVEELKSWAPETAGAVAAIQRIAQAWNPYQTWWFLSQQECSFY